MIRALRRFLDWYIRERFHLDSLEQYLQDREKRRPTLKAILERDAPKSCGECTLRVDNLGHSLCPAVRDKKGWPREVPHRQESRSRASFCPLKIVPETSKNILKPCPFCGNKARLVCHIEIGCYDVHCENCNCPCYLLERNYTDMQTAIAAWNRREGNENK